MKVTKIVREFVEEEISKKYPMPEPDKVGMAQLDNDISNAKERIRKEAGEFIFNKMKEAGIVIDERMVGIKVIDWRYFDKNGVSYYNGTVNALRAAYEEVSNKVKDSAASDVVGAINGLGKGWKLTKQTSQKERDGRRSYLEFKHDKFVNGNIPKMVKELEHAFQKLGYKESVYGDFVNQRNGNVLTPDYYDGMASILIIEKDNK